MSIRPPDSDEQAHTRHEIMAARGYTMPRSGVPVAQEPRKRSPGTHTTPETAERHTA